MRSTRRTGFTLFELLLVVLLIALIASFTWPVFFESARKAQLGESASRMKSMISMCRAEAMNQARRYRFTFALDGRVRVTRQADAIDAPDEYILVRSDWSHTQVLLDEVWIESLLPLPEGPPPIVIDDEEIVFEEEEYPEDFEPILLEDFDEPIEIDFEPDGTSDSVRWVLRDSGGRGLEVTLDGRLGRFTTRAVESIPEDDVVRPEREPIEYEDDEYESARGFG